MKHGSLSLCIIMTCTLKCVCYYNEITHDLTILFISLPPSLSFISHPSLSLSLSQSIQDFAHRRIKRWKDDDCYSSLRGQVYV